MNKLRKNVRSQLEHTYFNAVTDEIAFQNGVIPNKKHVPGVINNKTDDTLQAVLEALPPVQTESNSWNYMIGYNEAVEDMKIIIRMAIEDKEN